MAISRRLVEAMGGTIGVVSSPGVGSTFWFTLPERAPSVASAAAPPATAPLTGARVLVVSACRALGESWRHILQRCTPHVDVWLELETAMGALEAATANGKPYDLVVVDAGHRADPAVRSLALATMERSTGLVVVAPAGYRQELRQLVASSGSQVLRKPVLRHEQLVAAAARALDRRAAAADSAPTSVVGLVNDRRTASAPPRVCRPRVLLAEDNDVNRLVATKMLKKAGCDVDLAVDGRAAVEMAGLAVYDLVLMDCNMPEMDGFEATALIRARAAGAPGTAADVPIVALTANALVGDRERCLASGMNDYIAKPIVPRALSEALARWTAIDGHGRSTDSVAS